MQLYLQRGLSLAHPGERCTLHQQHTLHCVRTPPLCSPPHSPLMESSPAPSLSVQATATVLHLSSRRYSGPAPCTPHAWRCEPFLAPGPRGHNLAGHSASSHHMPCPFPALKHTTVWSTSRRISTAVSPTAAPGLHRPCLQISPQMSPPPGSPPQTPPSRSVGRYQDHCA